MDFLNKQQLANLQKVVKSKEIKNKEKMSDYVPDGLPIGNPPYQINNW